MEAIWKQMSSRRGHPQQPLLRQSHGFEGGLPRGERGDARDLVPNDVVDDPKIPVNRHTTGLPATLLVDESNNRVSPGGDQFGCLVVVGVECSPEAPDESVDLVHADGRLVRAETRKVDHGIPVEKRGSDFSIALSVCANLLADDSKCLLRHRPRSIALLRQPHGFEGLLSVEVAHEAHDLATANGDDVRLFQLCRDPAARTATALAGHGDHLIPVVDQLLDH
jgi:hypothetical protein